MTTIDRFKLAAQSLEALNKLKSKKNSYVTENFNYNNRKKNYTKLVFEEYDEDAFTTKVKADALFYKTFVKRLDPKFENSIEKIIGGLLQNVRAIYEYINIKPKIYGFNVSEVLNSSEDILSKKSVQIITEFIDRNYYRMDRNQLEKEYLSRISPIAREMILNEQIEPDEAIRFALKVAVIETLLEKVSFPMTIKDKVVEIVESKDDLFFDHTGLDQLWKTFQVQIHELSKVIAAVI